MTSRLRGPSAVKDTPRTASFAKDDFHRPNRSEPEAHSGRSCKNGGRGNRYHFGMSKQHDSKTERNGREYKEEMEDNNVDLLYKKSKEHFGSWDIKDDARRSRRQDLEDAQVTNGKFRRDSSEPVSAKFLDKTQDRLEYRDEGYVGSLPRENRQKGETVERELNGSHRSRRKEYWEESVEAKNRGKMGKISRNNDSNNDTTQPVDERDILLKEIESLATDGSQSPDRRIQAMIERLKSREENKLRSRREQRSEVSPDKEANDRAKSGSKSDARSPIIDHSPDNRSKDRNRKLKDDREDERRSGEYKLRGKSDREEDSGRCDRSIDRRSKSIERQNEDREPRGDDTFRKRSDTYNTERNYRRKSKEDDEARSRDSSKRRSYTYEGSPEDFDVRIQRYDRALLEPRRDLDRSSSRRSSPRDSSLVRKESLKEFDQEPIVKKNSFRTESRRASKDCGESSLTRKTSFKDQDNDIYKNHISNSQHDTSIRYFGKDQEDLSHKNSFKDKNIDVDRKGIYKVQELGRTFLKNQHDSTERKISSKEHTSGVSRIILRNFDDDSNRNNSFQNTSEDSEKKNVLKEKSVEFGKISYKDGENHSERKKNSFKDDDEEFGQTSYHDYENNIDRKTANDRYIEFGKISFKTEDDELCSPNSFKEEDNEAVVRTSSFKERDASSKRRVSLRNRGREAFERKSERHSKPLTPPKKDDPEDNAKELKNFSPKSWYESNRMFSARYLRNHSKLRSAPEGRLDVDVSPERGFSNLQNARTAIEASANDPEEDRFEIRDRIDSGDGGSPQVSSSRDRNGATIIRIRSSEDPDNAAERVRRRRRPVQELCVARRRRYDDNDEDSDEDDEEETRWRRTRRDGGILPGRDGGDANSTTPSRTIWNYREGGALITDVEEGQPCLQCGERCLGFSPHIWRKNCTSCKCPREAHDVCHEEWVSVRSRLGLKGDESNGPIGVDPRERGLAWAPPGLPSHKIEEYFSMLPEIAIPRLGTPGERHRDRQLAIQLPKQDLARAYCRHLDPKHASSADDFMAARNEIALDIGSAQEVLERDLECGVCGLSLKYGSLAVSASKLGLLYHPACFSCADCKELLVDLAYCVHDDTLFCERHYAEQLKPRCAACDELIFSGEYTKAMNKDWHSGHFCCWQCDESLTGQRYVLRDEHPYCIKCYESVFANGCEECSKIIGIDSKDLSYKDKHWHEACFLCNKCRVSLVDKQFGSKLDKIYCGNCYDAQFASRCDGCGEIFRAGTKKMEYKTRQWHEKCFCCVVCKNPIGTKSFIPREQEIYCAGCYEDKFATRCVKCNKIITSGGVTYKNEPWHRDCFTCSNCNNSLAGQRFTSRDDKPYCAECFGELFAKRCTACSKPITGIGGTRFISFEDRHWHNDCFICAGCKTSLVGRGFITDGDDIICPECAKMKLM
ncbi:Four and a half LIM domains protein 2 [Formica fusca]